MADTDDDDAPRAVAEWVVTYGDMMSLLLTFFIMLVSLSEVVLEEKYRAILHALQRYTGYRTGPAAPPGNSFPLNSLITQLETLGSHTNEDQGRGGIKSPGVPGQDVRVFRTPEGAPRTIGPAVVFAPGEVSLSEAARAKLRRIAADLAGKPNKIEVRAHAGPAPPAADGEFADKVVLSYQRGRAVLRFLEGEGIAHDRLRITAAGDSEPLPDSGDRITLHHDRVEVVILDTFAEEYVGPRSPASPSDSN